MIIIIIERIGIIPRGTSTNVTIAPMQGASQFILTAVVISAIHINNLATLLFSKSNSLLFSFSF